MTNTQLYLIFFTVLNLILISTAGYYGTPQPTDGVQAFLGHSIDLICEYNGMDGDGEFLQWYRNGNNSVINEKLGHYIVKNTKRESKLTIKIFVQSDSEVNKWSVRTNKSINQEPVECQFGRISLKPSPQGITTNRRNEKIDSSHGSIRRIEDESINLVCLIRPNQIPSDRTNTIQWTFSKDGEKYSQLPNGVTYLDHDQLFISRVKKEHRGYYDCSLNGISFTVLLRVKDRLAALWPVLGIISVILILVIVIIIFEKRQKLSRKTAKADNEDHANDPLVRSANKSSDNDNKKRAVRA